MQAELELKKEAIKFAVEETQRNGFASDITLVVFQHIRINERLCTLYQRAIGDRPGGDSGNHIKARINRNFGAAIKTAVGGVPQTQNGNAVKVQVAGEFIKSYTPLDPGPAKRN
jgi:hypothetical protein